MPRADVLPSPTTSATPSTEIELELTLAPGSDAALLRVVSTLHRRRCRVLRASLEESDRAGDRLRLRVAAPPRYATQLEHWLRALIEVDEVATVTRAGEQVTRAGEQVTRADGRRHPHGVRSDPGLTWART